MNKPPNVLTVFAQNGHLRNTSLIAEEFRRIRECEEISAAAGNDPLLLSWPIFTPAHGLGPAVWVAGNSGSAQFLAAMPATRPSTSVQGAAFRAGEVHGTGEEVGESGAYPQDDDQQRNLEKHVAHGNSTSALPGNTCILLPFLGPGRMSPSCSFFRPAVRSVVTIHSAVAICERRETRRKARVIREFQIW
jgi:hypothetical protein